jgi:putative transposase
VVRQCELLSLCRSRLYYRPRPVPEADLRLMRRIDELHLSHPFFGARKLAALLRREGFDVGRRHVGTLMRRMGLEALYPKKRTSLPAPGHRIYPYLLSGVTIEQPNDAWAADITYLPLARGFAYLVAIVDLASRKVLAHRVSNTMAVDFCVAALEEALRHYGKPEIFNTDQGAQFTSPDFTRVLKREEIRISMDGKGRATDNIFVERVWRSLKYEDVYLRDYATLAEAQEGVGRWIRFYNLRRPHQALDNRTPMEVYRGFHVVRKEAA